MIDAVTALGGATAGIGLTMIAAALWPPRPDLRRTVLHLQGRTATRPPTRLPSGPDEDDVDVPLRSSALGRWSGRLARQWAAHLSDRVAATSTDAASWGPLQPLRLHRLATDLALLDESMELLVVRKVGYAVLGMAFPPVAATAIALLGTSLPWTVPGFAVVAVASVLFVVPDLDVRARAARARAELRRAVCIYIDLVALERAADAGPIEALERAAGLEDVPAFRRIRDALTRAHLDGQPPWRGLHALAEATGVNELADLADIMAASGRQGASVYASLRARATSLRTAITAEDTATANNASERMVIPVALLGLIFMALIAFPAVARIALDG